MAVLTDLGVRPFAAYEACWDAQRMPAGSYAPSHATKHAQHKSFAGSPFASCFAVSRIEFAKSNPSVPEHRQAPTPVLIEHGRPNISLRQGHHKWHACSSAAGHIA